MKSCAIILDYCGGEATNKLYEEMKLMNPQNEILVYDNGSHANASKYVTHSSGYNTFVGGGIINSIRIAMKEGCRYLLLITNDVVFKNMVVIDELVERMELIPDLVQISTSLTPSSDKVAIYPWMEYQPQGVLDYREVPHSDLLCSLLRLDFIRSFGGFPISIGGWGYDLELGYQAKLQNKKVEVCDKFILHHDDTNVSQMLNAYKAKEMMQLYNDRYGDYSKITLSNGRYGD